MQGYYRIIPDYIAIDKRLTAEEKLFLSFLTALITKYGFCWASNKYMAEQAGKSVRTVKRYINKLDRLGFVVVETESHNNRKIWTHESYSNRALLEKAYGKEQINQTFTTWATDVPGVGHPCHTPAIYNKVKNTRDEKKEGGGNICSSAAPPPPPYFQKKPDKPKPDKPKYELAEEDKTRLSNMMGSKALDKYTRNAVRFLESKSNTRLHAIPFAEVILQFWAEDREAAKKNAEDREANKERVAEKGREFVQTVIAQNPHVKSHITMDKTTVALGISLGVYNAPNVRYDDPTLVDQTIAFLKKLGLPYRIQ